MGTDRFVFPTLQNQRNYEHWFLTLLDIQTLIIFLNIHGVLFSCCTSNQLYKVHWISLIFSYTNLIHIKNKYWYGNSLNFQLIEKLKSDKHK